MTNNDKPSAAVTFAVDIDGEVEFFNASGTVMGDSMTNLMDLGGSLVDGVREKAAMWCRGLDTPAKGWDGHHKVVVSGGLRVGTWTVGARVDLKTSGDPTPIARTATHTVRADLMKKIDNAYRGRPETQAADQQPLPERMARTLRGRR